MFIRYLYKNRSILSRNNGTSECTGSSNVGNSSFRCNNQWSGAYYPSNECSTTTPHHHHRYPPQYNQFANGSTSNFNNNNQRNNNNVLPPHGRLQKSLSFAFQTPAMLNEMNHQQPGSCHNQSNSINYPERSYSRFASLKNFYYNLSSIITFSVCNR